MKNNLSSVLWGLVLVIIGGFALANEMGYLDGFSTTTWMLLFAAASAVFFVAYFVNGIRAWGWLFPACIFAALAGTLRLANSAAADNWIPTLVIGSVAIPFFVAFALDRARAWALIPAFILGFVAFIPPLDSVLGSDAMGAFVVAMIGLPFIVVYLVSPKVWWGIIPGGILLSVAFMIGLDSIIHNDLAVALMFLGWMLTFGIVWLRNARPWAKVVAIVMGALTCIMTLVALGFETYWALVLIIAGVVLVYYGLRPRRTPVVK